MDEYLGLPASHPASFRLFMKEKIDDLNAPDNRVWMLVALGGAFQEVKRDKEWDRRKTPEDRVALVNEQLTRARKDPVKERRILMDIIALYDKHSDFNAQVSEARKLMGR